MTFRVLEQHGLGNAQSPFRVIEETGREVAWVNRFLDQERVRSVSDATLRSYAHDLLHFVRWWVGVNRTDAVTEKALTENALLGLHSLPDQPASPAHRYQYQSQGGHC